MRLVAAEPLTPRAAQLRAALDAEGGDVTIWAEPWSRTAPLPPEGAGVHVMDLHGAVAACRWEGGSRLVAGMCRGASLALVGSPAEYGFWAALFERHAVSCPLAVVPYATAGRPLVDGKALAIAGPWVVDPELRPMLEAALAWAQEAGVPVSGGAAGDAMGALAVAALAPGTAAPAMLLDLRRDTAAERVATPSWVVDALAAGIPVLTTVDGPLGQAIAAAGAGRVLTSGFMPPPEGAAAAARCLAPDPATAATALRAALARAAGRDAATRAAWCGPRPPAALGPRGRVLILSDEAETIFAVRVRLPFEALLRRGVIAGYAVLNRGGVAFDSHPGAAEGFDAIWVHRSGEPRTRLLLELLDRPFVYDIDDNLLAAPRYRPPFPPIAVATTKDLLRRATVVSCATARLGRLLGARLGEDLAARLVVTPNLADGPPAPREPGIPRALIWASSDRPALAGSAGAIARAVRDHGLAHGSPILCMGAEPPDELRVPGLELEHVPVIPNAEYRARLRAMSPAILVCPLETGADPDTQDFIDGKSDIKRIEALASGLVGVFSRAAPYVDAMLPDAILTENTYEAWLAGLEAARAACLALPPPCGWPEDRDAASFGLAPWATALARARLANPITLAEALQAMQEAKALQGAPIDEDEFDEEDYLANYDDVRAAVAAGALPSGHAHYAGPGRAEGRFACKRSESDTLGDAWWARLLHEVARLETVSATRAAALAGFERRLALRRAVAARQAR